MKNKTKVSIIAGAGVAACIGATLIAIKNGRNKCKKPKVYKGNNMLTVPSDKENMQQDSDGESDDNEHNLNRAEEEILETKEQVASSIASNGVQNEQLKMELNIEAPKEAMEFNQKLVKKIKNETRIGKALKKDLNKRKSARVEQQEFDLVSKYSPRDTSNSL